MHIWVRCGGNGHVHKRALLRAHAHLTIGIDYKYRAQHVGFRYPTAAAAHAYRALRSALTAWTKVSPIWHI
eukprot:7163975-Pyramimonas_sp.AAC.1